MLETVSKSLETEPASPRVNDPDGVRADIMEVATREFAEKGLSGARVDEIAAKTRTSKRMIYYYFKDKEGLFLAVLEAAYARIRAIEATLDLAGLAPVAAMRRLAEFTFDYQNANPDFVRLVMVENIHKGDHIARSQTLRGTNVSVLETLRGIYARGVAAGVFRPGLDPVDLHMTISALSFFNVANRATFSHIFEREMGTPEALEHRRKVAAETLLGYVMNERGKAA